MSMPSISNGQAQVLIGLVGIGIALYAIYQTKDTIAKAATATKDALDPTSDKNLAYKATSGVLGEDFVIDKIGGGVAGIVNWFKGEDSKNKSVSVLKPVVLNESAIKLITPVTTVQEPFLFYKHKAK